MSFLAYVDQIDRFFARFEATELKPQKTSDGWKVTVGPITYHTRLDVNAEEFCNILQYRVFNGLLQFLVQHQRCIIEEGDTVMEVGAYEGLYTLKLAELVGQTGEVHACELMPQYADVIRLNFEQNQVQGKVFSCGVSPEGGMVEVYSGVGQVNGLREDVISRYIDQDQMTIQQLETQTLDQIFEQLDLKDPMKLLILMINGIEMDVLRTFSYFDLVDNLYFAMKYTDMDDVYSAMKFLAEKGFRTEQHQSFMYAKRCHLPVHELRSPLWLVNDPILVPHAAEIIEPELTKALVSNLILLNKPTTYYSKISIEQIVKLVMLGEKYYPDRFPTLDEIDAVTYPFELFAVIVNKIAQGNVLTLVFEDEWIDHMAYLIINLNRHTKKIKIGVKGSLTTQDHNSRLLFNPKAPR